MRSRLTRVLRLGSDAPDDAPGLLGGSLCGCGCGRNAVEGTEMHAVLLAASRRSLRRLRAKAKSGGARTRRAQHLLWAWNRCEDGFDAYVHGRPMWECGPPTPLWINAWRRRVDEL